jgi:hypothetical protein
MALIESFAFVYKICLCLYELPLFIRVDLTGKAGIDYTS